jgi:hypothetical protein
MTALGDYSGVKPRSEKTLERASEDAVTRAEGDRVATRNDNRRSTPGRHHSAKKPVHERHFSRSRIGGSKDILYVNERYP